MDALAPASGETVLDIGCGAGQTLCQLAERVGPQGRVVGIDIAPELLDIARRRTHAIGTVSLVEADAQSVDWPQAQADAVFSRFGVMAFADPVVAFGHLRRLLKPDGRLGFVCWQAFDRNPLDHVPLRAAGVRAPVDAAPFSLAEPDVVRAVLGRAGFEAIDIRAHSQPVSSGDLDATTEVLLRVGPLGRIVREIPACARTPSRGCAPPSRGSAIPPRCT